MFSKEIYFTGISREYCSNSGQGPFYTNFRVCVMLIVENPTLTDVQNSNKTADSLLQLLSKCNVGQFLMFKYFQVAVVIVWQLDLQLHMQPMPVTTNVVSSNYAQVGMYSIQHYVIKIVSDLWQVDGFHRGFLFLPPIKLTATI